MAERSRIFDDIAGMAGGAFSTLAGIGDEVGAIVRSRVDEALARLQLVRREEFEAVSELAANARDEAEQATARIAALEARVSGLESHKPESSHAADPASPHDHPAGGAPGGPPPHAAVDGESNRADALPTTD